MKLRATFWQNLYAAPAEQTLSYAILKNYPCVKKGISGSKSDLSFLGSHEASH